MTDTTAETTEPETTEPAETTTRRRTRPTQAAREAAQAPAAWKPAAFKIRLGDGSVVTVTPPDCPCGDMTFHHPVGDSETCCKHLRAFYDNKLAALLAPGQDTWTMGSFTNRRHPGGALVTYQLTLMTCSVHGVLTKACDHAEAIAPMLGWTSLLEEEQEEG